MSYETLNSQILECCPDLTADEAAETGKNLVALLKILHEVVQEEPELEKFLTAQMKGDFINEQE
ncbi:MAG: hypothetical protein ACLTT2_01245 [Alphaproteobacteria bacterium]